MRRGSILRTAFGPLAAAVVAVGLVGGAAGASSAVSGSSAPGSLGTERARLDRLNEQLDASTRLQKVQAKVQRLSARPTTVSDDVGRAP